MKLCIVQFQLHLNITDNMYKNKGFGQFALIVLALVFSIPLYAQREQVNLKTRNAASMRTFTYHQPSNWDVVNGKINIALSAANGYVFEINGISTKTLKCAAKLKPGQYKVVLIDDRMGKTYTSTDKSSGTLLINCLSDGEYELVYTGEIYLDQKKVSVNATLRGSLNHSKNLKTTR